MSRFVQVIDFKTGKLQISENCSADLQLCIDTVEPDILTSLLGCELYDLFIEDWDASNPNPNEFSEQRFIDIFDPSCKDDDCKVQIKSTGIKDMIMHFVYFEFIRFQASQNRTNGQVRDTTENSENVSFNQMGLFNTYNKGIYTYCAIQWLICEDSATYPKYNGQLKQLMSWL